MRIEQSQTVVGFYTVHVDSNELMCDKRPLPYPTCIGVIDVRRPGLKIDVWTPAASVPRGYKRAARALLEQASDAVWEHFKGLWFEGRRVPANYGWSFDLPSCTLKQSGAPWLKLERVRCPETGRYHAEPAQVEQIAHILLNRLQSRTDEVV